MSTQMSTEVSDKLELVTCERNGTLLRIEPLSSLQTARFGKDYFARFGEIRSFELENAPKKETDRPAFKCLVDFMYEGATESCQKEVRSLIKQEFGTHLLRHQRQNKPSQIERKLKQYQCMPPRKQPKRVQIVSPETPLDNSF